MFRILINGRVYIVSLAELEKIQVKGISYIYVINN